MENGSLAPSIHDLISHFPDELVVEHSGMFVL